MSVRYVAVQWNRHKRIYDALVAIGVIAYLIVFVLVGKLLFRGAEAISDEILVLRALGSCAFLLLNVILCIGPLARLDRHFLPLLYNRRHLGVTTFLLGLAHGLLAIGFYHGFGHLNPLISLLTSNTNFGTLSAFPFQLLGAAGLSIMFVMAATSHDFWNRNLGPRVWKGIHMLVYLAYGLLVMHVALGAMQTHRGAWLSILVCLGAFVVATLHLIAGRREYARDLHGAAAAESADPWVDVGSVDEIAEGRGKAACLANGERIAIFRYAGGISALTNVCAHQGGPLGEGKIIDGCVTCPWHGWTYRPEDGRAPPPFTEKVPTYRVRVESRRILVDPRPLEAGTPVEPARFSEDTHA
ncbi:MAG TPA: Rieske 2Fe-2S domain-containing protein [Phycisphaerae bacterium]|nr:Rieske 2Fe-2S domain-containing protein [Phycisphaerae bacterium]